MPRQTKDRDTTWDITGNNKTWTLAAKATIDTTDPFGIDVRGDGNHINVLGKVLAGSYGVRIERPDGSLTVGAQGMVVGDGTYGVTFSNVLFEAHVVNKGLISGGAAAISASGGGRIENSGDIFGGIRGINLTGEEALVRNTGHISGGGTGIELISEKSRIVNEQSGTITGNETGVDFRLGGTHVLVNKGTIAGIDSAVSSTDGTTVRIVNTGTIVGDILLGNGADRIDTRGGTVLGAINGGEGDDTYLVSRSNTRIVDMGASYGDTVRSTASFTLTGGLDDLYLLGSKNINGTGNGGDNFIAGNKANNRLEGGAGFDTLSGAGGKDVLTGGAGGDFFIFDRGFGVDRITDFTDGLDKIVSHEVVTQRDFDRLDIRQAGDDLVIDFGRGDRLILEDVQLGSFDYSDFALP